MSRALLRSLLPILLLAIHSAPAAFGCAIGGRFVEIVHDKFGRHWAETQTAYSMMVVEPAGDVLCEEHVRPDRVIYPASTIKSLIALAVLRKVDRGELRLDQAIPIDQPNAAKECRYWDCTEYGPGASVTVRKLLFDAITVSNNLASNQLLDLAGKAFVNETAQALGASTLRVFRKVYDEVDPEPEITTPNEATSPGLAALYREISTGRLGLLTEQSRALLVEALGEQRYNTSLNGDFPEGVRFFHKTGSTSRVSGDAGWYPLPDGRIVILAGLQDFNRYRVCRRGGGCRWHWGSRGLRLVGRAAYDLSVRLLSP